MRRTSNDPQHWKMLADEMRDAAERLADPKARKHVLVVAKQFDKLAERAVERLMDLARARASIARR